MTRDGKLSIPFDQEMIVPDFMTNNSGNKGRKLITKDQIDVKRDILEYNFLLKSDTDPEDIKYYMKIDQWDSKGLKI